MIILRGGGGKGCVCVFLCMEKQSRDGTLGSAPDTISKAMTTICTNVPGRGNRLAGKWPREMAQAKGKAAGMSGLFIACKNKPTGQRRMQGIYIKQLQKQVAGVGAQGGRDSTGPHGKPFVSILDLMTSDSMGFTATGQPLPKFALIDLCHQLSHTFLTVSLTEHSKTYFCLNMHRRTAPEGCCFIHTYQSKPHSIQRHLFLGFHAYDLPVDPTEINMYFYLEASPTAHSKTHLRTHRTVSKDIPMRIDKTLQNKKAV